jgi:hypothetical protein
LLDVDPVGLVRGWRGPSGDEGMLGRYVNDRPYVASSFLSVAMARVLGSAMKGESKDRPELAASELPLEIEIAALPCRGGEALLRRLFEPLGYDVRATRLPLDEQFPAWGESAYFAVKLAASKRLAADAQSARSTQRLIDLRRRASSKPGWATQRLSEAGKHGVT